MAHPQDVYVSTTEFKANLKHYKELAKTSVVHVTEHGRADSVLLSLDLFEQRKAEACHRARWQVWAEHACFRGTHDSFRGSELSSQAAIEYLGHPWEGSIAPSFADDIHERELSKQEALIVQGCLHRLTANPHAGRPIELGPDAYLPAGTTAYRLSAGDFDIIYGSSGNGDVRVYGLIPSLTTVL